MKAEKNDCFGLCSMGRIIQLILRTIRVFSLFLLYPGLTQEASGSENTPGDSSSFIFYFRDQSKILERFYGKNGAETEHRSAYQKKQTVPFIAISTNLLYLAGITPEPDWTGAIPNAEIAWYFGKRWSLNAGVSYAHFEKSNEDHEIRGLSSLALEPRIWLSGSNLYKGLYAGLYALTGDFDVKPNDLSPHGQTGTFQEGGLSLGYYLPFSQRWGVEAGVRAGYRTVDCDRYLCQGSHYYYQSTHTQDGIKLTGFSLLIVYRMGKSCKQIK